MGIRKSDDVLDAEWRSLEKQPLSKRPPQLVVPTRPKSSRRYHAWVFVLTHFGFSFLFCLSIDSGLFGIPILVLCIWTIVVTGVTKNYLNRK